MDRDAAIRAPFDAFGGVWVDAPVLQPLAQLLDLAGEAMRARLFVVAGGEEDQALRPDFTIPITRAHIASGQARGRYLYAGKAFRAPDGGPNSDAGAETEFPQIGAELFGAGEDPAADDAVIAALAWQASAAGGRSDLSIRFGDIGLFRAFLTVIGAPEAAAARLMRAFANNRALTELHRVPAAPTAEAGRLADLLGGLAEEEATGVLEELWRLAGIQPVGGRSAAEIVHRLAGKAEAARAPALSPAEAGLIGRFLAIEASPRQTLDAAESLAAEGGGDLGPAIAPWTARLKALVGAGAPEAAMTLSTGFVRPFGYYDGVLFEVRSAALGPDAPVAAGGRYDGLPERLGGARGAVGCMVRPDRAKS